MGANPASTHADLTWGNAHFWPSGARWRGVMGFAAIFSAYVGVALLYPYTESSGVALLWLPNAVLITALLKFRPRDWPYVYAAGLLAEVVVDLRVDMVPSHALHFGLVNVVEATLYVLAAAVIAGGRGGIGLLSVRGTAAVVLASVAVPALTATVGAIGTVWAFDADYFTGWRTWWFGDAVGLLVGVPIGLLLRDAVRSVARRHLTRQALGIGAGAAVLMTASTGLAVIGHTWGAQLIAIAAAVLLSLTFGAVGAPAGAVLTATVTLVGLARQEGLASAPEEQALLFVAVAAVYSIAAATESADQAEQRLKRQRRDLIEAKQKLSTEKERFESVVGNTPSAISVRDVQHRYTLVNDAFCQLFGQKSARDVIGRTEDDILPTDVLRRSQRAVAQLLGGEDHLEEESIQVGADTISVITQQFPLRNTTGAITELVTIRTDITHRKKIERAAAERAKWQELISSAIDAGRLLVYSQPIIDIASGRTVGEELLIRMRSADTDEILPPSAFLPQCERYALMPTIDRYMVERAIELAHLGRRVSVNITGQTIADATTMEPILGALSAAGPDVTKKIDFEITETTAVASPAMAKAFSSSMRDLGCRVALDDFGTGYGTFTELRHLALYALKIDRSFVLKMLEDSDDDRVVTTIISVAKTYGLTTIAEGVESQPVLDRLAELGADLAQGYHFGKPAPIST